MIRTIDKYGFTEEAGEVKIKETDKIGVALGNRGYIENYSYKGVSFCRFYWNSNVLVDLFNRKGAEIEVNYKQSLCKMDKMIYIPIRKGEKLTTEDLRKYIKGGK
jgi:hypothetical protein